MNYECHITVHVQHAKAAEAVAKDLHWKTSQIDGDPVLGDRPFFYLTTHCSNVEDMMHRMRMCTDMLERVNGVPVIREKIELIIHDTKTRRKLELSDVMQTNEMVAFRTTVRPHTNAGPTDVSNGQ